MTRKGQRITAGQGEDRDSGTIDAIDGDQVTVRWDSGVVTTQTAAALGLSDDADDYLVCDLCGAETPSAEAAIEAGWVPSYWDGDAEVDRPVCSGCVATRLRMVDGEWELIR